MRMAWSIVAALCLHGVGCLLTPVAAADMPPDVIVIPTPRAIDQAPGAGWVAATSVDLVVTGANAAVQTAADDLAQDLTALAGGTATVGVAASLEAAAADVVVVLGITFSAAGHVIPEPPVNPEGYAIASAEREGRWFMYLNGRDARGALWATKTLKQLVRASGAGLEFLPCTVTDWPWYPLRSTSINFNDAETVWGALDYKINTPYFGWFSLGTAWRDPPVWYRDAVASIAEDLARRGLDMLHIVHPYWVAENDPPWLMSIRATNDGDFDSLMSTFELSLDAGNGIVDLAFDDGAQLVPPEDLALFGTWEQVHAETFHRFSADLSNEHPDVELVFLPRPYYAIPRPYLDPFTNMPAETILTWTGPSGIAVSLTYDDADLAAYTNAIEGRRFIIHDNTPYQRYGLGRGWCLFDSYADGYGNLYQHCHGIKASYNFRYSQQILLAHGMVIAEYMWNADRYDAEDAVTRVMAKIGGWAAVPHLQAFKTHYVDLAARYPVENVQQGLTEEDLDQLDVSIATFVADRATLELAGQALEEVAGTCPNDELVAELESRYADLVYLFDVMEQQVFTIAYTDLHAYWKLDGNLMDSAGADNGSFVDQDGGGVDVAYVAGFDGTTNGALDFAGTTDHVITPYVTHTGAKSVSFFFSTRQNSAAELMCGSGGSARFYHGAHHPNAFGGSLVAGIGDGGKFVRPDDADDFTPVGSVVSTANTWHHYVLTDDGAGNAIIYYRSPSDAQHLVCTTNYSGTTGGSDIFAIGAFDGGAWPASGMVDDVAVLNRVLTQTEVESIYDAGSLAAVLLEQPGLDAVFTPGDLYAYWKLDGDLDDAGRFGYHGTLSDEDGPGSNVVYAAGFGGETNSALDFGGTTDNVATPFIAPVGTKAVSVFFTTRQNTAAELTGGSGGDNRFYFGAHHPSAFGGSLVGALGLTARFVRPDTDFTPVGTPVVPDDSWNHYVLNDDGAGQMEIYYRSPRDSQHLVYTNTYAGTSGGVEAFRIGGWSGGGWPASGRIDDLAVFDRVLTAAEVEAIYYAGSVAPLIDEGDPATVLVFR